MDETTEVAKSDLAPESAAELEYDADSTGISVRGTGLYGPGIGRVGFVLIDLGQEPPANVLDREDVEYAAPLPKRVTEAWRSAALTPGAPHRVFFHVYDRSGVNLVAYDRCDFTWHQATKEIRT